jgi:hypothetical protein
MILAAVRMEITRNGQVQTALHMCVASTRRRRAENETDTRISDEGKAARFFCATEQRCNATILSGDGVSLAVVLCRSDIGRHRSRRETQSSLNKA